MAELNFKEKRYLERILEMSQGYVLDFYNNTFQEFIIDTMGVDIYSEKYSENGESKANRLRTFWKIESNYHVGQLIEHLLEYWLTQVQFGERSHNNADEKIHDECLKIVQRLKSGGPVENLDSIRPNSNDESFEKLAKSIKQSINDNEPEVGIDRLHTFVTKYIRQLCEEHKIPFQKETPLHSLFGSYVKQLKSSGLIETEMTERILKSSISVMEAFNKVRNDQSLAHDNEILKYNESLLIFNDIANVIRFIEALEKENKPVEEDKNSEEDWDLPF